MHRTHIDAEATTETEYSGRLAGWTAHTGITPAENVASGDAYAGPEYHLGIART